MIFLLMVQQLNKYETSIYTIHTEWRKLTIIATVTDDPDLVRFTY
jgi:hypothetical protein